MKDTVGNTGGKSNRPRIHESVPFGVLLAVVGGFLDGYTYIGRDGVLANAQTGNIVFLGICISKGEWSRIIIYLTPITAFIIGVLVAEIIKNNSSHLFMMEWAQTVLILETLILVIIGFVPRTIPNIVVTASISFVASLQSFSFRKLVDSPFTTVMCTGNLRSASHALYTAISKKDKEAGVRSFRYFAVIFSFLTGVVTGGVLTMAAGDKAVWGCALLLAAAVSIFHFDRQTK